MSSRPSLRRQLNLLLIGLLIGAAFTLVTLGGLPLRSSTASTPAAEGEPEQPQTSPDVGVRAPGWTLEEVGGEILTLEAYQGQVVLLNFWAVWCGPCVIEMPILQDRFESFGAEGLVVLGINFDDPQEDVQVFKDGLELTFPLLLDPGGEVQALYRIRGYPSSVFLDREGVIRFIHIGLMTEDQLDGYLRELDL